MVAMMVVCSQARPVLLRVSMLAAMLAEASRPPRILVLAVGSAVMEKKWGTGIRGAFD